MGLADAGGRTLETGTWGSITTGATGIGVASFPLSVLKKACDMAGERVRAWLI